MERIKKLGTAVAAKGPCDSSNASAEKEEEDSKSIQETKRIKDLLQRPRGIWAQGFPPKK